VAAELKKIPIYPSPRYQYCRRPGQCHCPTKTGGREGYLISKKKEANLALLPTIPLKIRLIQYNDKKNVNSIIIYKRLN